MPTVAELLYRSYANLAMAHAAVEEGAATYGRLHFMIRARLLKGLSSGTMSIGSLLDDERLKMTLPQMPGATYCVVHRVIEPRQLYRRCDDEPRHRP